MAQACPGSRKGGGAGLPQTTKGMSGLTSLRAPDDCPGEVFHDSLGGWWGQVVIPIHNQPQVLKIHPIEK